MAEGVLDLTVAVPPERVVQGLPNGRAGRDRLGEGGLGVTDLKRQDDGRSAQRRGRQDA